MGCKRWGSMAGFEQRECVYVHSDEILLALDKYAAMDASGRGSFVSKLSQLNSDVFNFLQEFFGVNFEDIEEGLQSEEQ